MVESPPDALPVTLKSMRRASLFRHILRCLRNSGGRLTFLYGGAPIL
jgi:hypothetical protein